MPRRKSEQPTPTLRVVHKALLNSESVQQAAKNLGMTDPKGLVNFVHILYYKLFNTTCIDKYKYKKLGWLKEKLPNSEAFQSLFGKDCYDEPYMDSWNDGKIDVSSLTIRQLHGFLQENPQTTISFLSILLRVSWSALNGKLGLLGLKTLPIFKPNSHPLGDSTTFAEKHYGEWYDRPISEYPYFKKIEETHPVKIIASKNIQQQPGNELLEAADLLQISPLPIDPEIELSSISEGELERLLPLETTINEFLSQHHEDSAQATTIESGINALMESSDRLTIMPHAELNQSTPKLYEVYPALICSQSIKEAAEKLGIQETEELKRFVRILSYKLFETTDLYKSYYTSIVDKLKNEYSNLEGLQELFGKNYYDKPYTECLDDIKNNPRFLTIRQLHNSLRKYPKANINALSVLLNVNWYTLKIKLKRLGLDKLPISEEVSHPLGGDTTGAQKHYKNWYDLPISKYPHFNKIEETHPVEITAMENTPQQPGHRSPEVNPFYNRTTHDEDDGQPTTSAIFPKLNDFNEAVLPQEVNMDETVLFSSEQVEKLCNELNNDPESFAFLNMPFNDVPADLLPVNAVNQTTVSSKRNLGPTRSEQLYFGNSIFSQNQATLGDVPPRPEKRHKQFYT